MKLIEGKHNTAKIFTDLVDDSTISQVQTLCDQASSEGSTIRIMPDCHYGKGCTIGTTMTIKDKVIPSLVGVDLSCGMRVVEIEDKKIDLQRLDKCIRRYVPHGSAVNRRPHRWADQVDLSQLRCKDHIKWQNQYNAIGSLGQGNHFISVEVDDNDTPHLVIHTGSRNLGLQIADYYQQAAYDKLHGSDSYHKDREAAERRAIVERLTAEGRQKEISKAFEEYKYDPGVPLDIMSIPFELSYCEGQLLEDYLHDAAIAQQFAILNRRAIADIIQCGMRWKVKDEWETLHNYIDLDHMILRKGAISAQKDELAIIPMNMRDGSLVVVGKGNKDWNYSAPHGAGRLMSRSEAKETIAMQDYKDSMEGIYSTSINAATKDEAPQAYKPMESIVENIQDTCEIIKRIKPVYNFKSS